MRFVVALALLLSACVLDEATPEDIAEVESEAALPPPVTTLTSGEYVTISAGAHAVRYFKLEVPAGFDHVYVARDGYLSGSGDFYVRRNQLPSPTNYDCTSGIYQGCSVDMPVSGTYYLAIYAGAGGFTNLTFRMRYGNSYSLIANPYSGFLYNQYGFDQKYKMVVPTDVSSVSFTYTLDPNDDGAIDVIVKRNAFATDQNWDCFQWINGYEGRSTATCTFTNPTPGTYYVLLRGHHTKVVGTFSARYKRALVSTPLDPIAAAP